MHEDFTISCHGMIIWRYTREVTRTAWCICLVFRGGLRDDDYRSNPTQVSTTIVFNGPRHESRHSQELYNQLQTAEETFNFCFVVHVFTAKRALNLWLKLSFLSSYFIGLLNLSFFGCNLGSTSFRQWQPLGLTVQPLNVLAFLGFVAHPCTWL